MAALISVKRAVVTELFNTDPFLTFEVALSEPAASSVQVQFLARPGTSGSGEFFGASGTLTLPAGQTTGQISVRIQSDALVEADESVLLELFNPTGAAFASGTQRLTATGIVLDDDGAGEKRAVLVDDVDLVEGDAGTRDAVFTVHLSRAAAVDLTFDYQTIGGSARAAEDFTAVSGTLTFVAGQTEATVQVPINGDTLSEGDESFGLLVRPQAGSASAIGNAADGAEGEARIADDDASTGPVVSITNAVVTELFNTDPFVAFDVTLSEPAAGNVQVQFLARQGTTGSGEFFANSGTLLLPPGQTTAQIFVRIQSDAVAEADETILLELFNPLGAVFAGGAQRLTATGIVLDDDGTGQKRALLVDDVELVEGDTGNQNAVFNVRLSRPAVVDLNFDFQTVPGSARAGEDFSPASGTLTFLAGQTKAAVHVPVIGDALREGDESFGLVVRPQVGSASAIGNAADGAEGRARIADDDASTGPVLSIKNAVVTELFNTDPFLTFEVTLSEPAANTVQVQFLAREGSSSSGEFFSNAGTLTILAGQTSAQVSVRIRSDATAESDETILLELFNPGGAVFTGGAQRLTATGIVFDDDGTGEKRALLVDDVELVEGDAGTQEAVFTVRLSRPAPVDLTFDFQTVAGSARSGEDFTPVSGALTFLAGQTEAAVHVPVSGDLIREGDESFGLVVRPQAGSASAIGNAADGAEGRARIADDDASTGPVLSITNAVVTELFNTDPFISFEVTLTEPAANAVQVQFLARERTTTSGEFFGSSGTLTLLPGQTSGQIAVRIRSDATAEADESVLLELYNPAGAVFAGGAQRLTATGFVLDDDGTGEKRALLVDNVDLVEGDSGAQEAVFAVRLSRPASVDLAFDFQTVAGSATAGEDYTPVTGTLAFVAGQTEAAVHVAVKGDTLRESDESFGLVVRPQTGSASAIANGLDGVEGRARIADDDASTGPVLSVKKAVVTELFNTDPFLAFEVTLTEPTTSSVSVQFLARAGTTGPTEFFATSGVLTLLPGQTSGQIFVRIRSDATAEADESVLLELSNPTGAVFAGGAQRLVATGIVLDDDGTGDKRALLVNNVELVEGDTGTQDAVFTVLLSRPAPVDLTFDFQTVSGTATAAEDFTAVSGALTFVAGQTEAVIHVPVSGDFKLEADETFTLSFAPTALVANGASGITATATIRSDDIQNPPTALPDAYTLTAGTPLAVNAVSGVLANDSDVEGDPLTASLVTAPAHGALTLNADGSFSYTAAGGFIGRDTFTYRASDGIGLSGPTTVTLDVRAVSSETAVTLTVPAALAPAQIGTSHVTYTNLGSAVPALLFFADADRALLADPLTGQFFDSIALLGLGDHTGAVQTSESGSFDLTTKMADAPRRFATVSISSADLTQTIDWAALQAPLRPELIPEAVWGRIYANLRAEVGSTGVSFVQVLADDARYLTSFGITGDSANAAFGAELEQASDFGSLAERGAQGSVGRGWAFVGDLHLDIASSGDVALRGSSDLDALSTLDAESSAYYSVSVSARHAVALTGNERVDMPAPRPTFHRNRDGSFDAQTNFDGELFRTAEGYRLERSNGDVLLFGDNGVFLKLIQLNGQETVPSYDLAGRISSLSGPNGSSLQIGRDSASRVVSIVDADGDTVTLGHIGDRLTAATSAAGTATFAYASSGDLTGATPAGGPTTTFTYDAAGRLSQLSVAGGAEITSFNYDDLGGYVLTDGAGHRITVEMLPGPGFGRVTDGAGGTVAFLYDLHGNLIGARMPDGAKTDLAFDALDRLTLFRDANGGTLTFAYEGPFPSPTRFTDANNATRTYTYDEHGQLSRVTWADGTSLGFSVDANGNVTSYTNRRGEIAELDYDARGRLISASDGTPGPATLTYDAAGRLLTATTTAGVTAFTYDSAGRVTEIEYPNGRSLSYTYDGAGRRTSMTDHDGRALFYEYDAAGRLDGLSDNTGTLVDYTYDRAGNVVREDNGNGTATTYSYDAAGRLQRIVNFDAGGAEHSHYTYSYDIAGRRIGMDTADGAWTYAYDATGQLTSANFDSTRAGLSDKSISYTYDLAGNRIRTVEDGAETIYASNALNQYESAGATVFRYDADGNLISKRDASGTSTYEYNLQNRLVSITAGNGSVTRYEYDLFGNRSAVIENGVRTEFLIDPFGLGNVVGEYAGNGTLTASFAHGVGLVSRRAADGSVAFYDFDGVGSVVGLTGSGGALVNSYAYTPFGNELYETEMVQNDFEFNGALGVAEDANGLHYMRARAYEPDLGRFISEDPRWFEGDMGNLYRFARNDPVSNNDPSGEVVALVPFGLGLLGGLFAGTVIQDIADAKDAPVPEKSAILFQAFLGLAIAGIATVSVPSALGFVAGVALFHFLNKKAHAAETIDTFNAPGATSWGDPHLVTFDRVAYDFQAAGEFTLVRDASRDFEIQARQEPYGRSTVVTVNTAVAMRVGDAVVGLYSGEAEPLNINGQFVGLASGETIAADAGSISRLGSLYVVTNAQGDGFLAVMRGSFINIYPFLSNDRTGPVSGLLGNHDGDRTNEIALADGTVLTGRVSAQQLYGAYADSWRVTPQTTMFVYGPGESPQTFADHTIPSRVITLADIDPAVRAAAEAIARSAGLTPGTIEFDAAVFDVAVTGDPIFAEAAANSPPVSLPGEERPIELPTDQPPAAANDVVTTGEDESVFIDVLANDTDPENDALTVIAAQAPAGSSVILQNGGILFTPALNSNGQITLSYTVGDTAGNQATGSVLVNVSAAEDPPVAHPDLFHTDENTSVSGNVLANNGSGADSDVDGDVLIVAAVNGQPANIGTSIALASGALLEINANGTFTYNPNGKFTHLQPGDSATDTFTYTISDGNGGEASATASIQIAGLANPTVEIVRIGDAPARLTSANPNAWVQAWTDEDVVITHKANVTNTSENWTPVTLTNSSPLTLAGSDVFLGDLGVSGQTAATSLVRQEIDGTEALRFQLDRDATRAILDLSRLQVNDEGSVFAEAGRVQLFDEHATLLLEEVFQASTANGSAQLTVELAEGFRSLVLTAGAYDGTRFVGGAYAAADGSFGAAPFTSGTQLRGSDFLVHTVEFQLLNSGVANAVDLLPA